MKLLLQLRQCIEHSGGCDHDGRLANEIENCGGYVVEQYRWSWLVEIPDNNLGAFLVWAYRNMDCFANQLIGGLLEIQFVADEQEWRG
jgi:hypothetical protein